MKIYPAIDLMDEKAVRLYKGKRETKRVYGDPVSIAEDFSEYVDKIHIVDLQGAFDGKPANLSIVEKIIEDVGVDVQLGGGLRSYEDVYEAYSIGVENVILSTKAFDLDFLEEVTKDFNRVTVSLDSSESNITVEGWEKEGECSVEDAYKRFREYVNRFIYTSTEKDGTLSGIDRISKFWDGEEFIYAGGVSSIDDVLSLITNGFNGVIIGKALYEKKLDLQDILEKVGDLDVS